MPQEGTTCPDNDLNCTFTAPAFGCPDPGTAGTSACQAGLWKTTAQPPACAPPGPNCPATLAAANGTGCPTAAQTGRCTYTSACSSGTVVFECVGGKLQQTEGDICDAGHDGDAD
jgi:hypothetical protein